MTKIKFINKNINPTSKQKQYIINKIKKHEKLLDRATNIVVLIKNNHNDHGSSRNIKIEVSVNMPHAFIRVEERGTSVLSLIDILEVTLKRRLKRYQSQYKKWSKKTPWKIEEFDLEMLNIEEDRQEVDSEFSPQIKMKEYSNDTPLHPAEAIEQMELLGHSSFLFKNIDSSKHAMIYKRDEGGYGLIQPKS